MVFINQLITGGHHPVFDSIKVYTSGTWECPGRWVLQDAQGCCTCAAARMTMSNDSFKKRGETPSKILPVYSFEGLLYCSTVLNNSQIG